MIHLILFENFSINEADKKKAPVKKKMADMSKDEKIAMYRSKVSKERKQPAPDQAKIDELVKNIEKLQKEDKPKNK